MFFFPANESKSQRFAPPLLQLLRPILPVLRATPAQPVLRQSCARSGGDHQLLDEAFQRRGFGEEEESRQPQSISFVRGTPTGLRTLLLTTYC